MKNINQLSNRATHQINNDWNISISFSHSSSQNFDRALYLSKQAPQYSQNEYNGKIIYQATYGKEPEEFLSFIKLYELISNWKSTAVFVNGKMIDRKVIGGLNYCYGDKCRSGNNKFCYGASYMTQNPFGCHRLQVSACNNPWWSFNRHVGNYYIINKIDIKHRIDEYGKNYKICPCYDEQKIYKVLEQLPNQISSNEYNNLQKGMSLSYTISMNPSNNIPTSTTTSQAIRNSTRQAIQHSIPIQHKNKNINYYSNKSKTVTLILAIIFGFFGIHRFYVGKAGSGILYLFTMGLFMFGWIYDIIKIASGTFTDGNGLPIKK